jgi:deoxyribose-phosphate aldolase
VAPVHQTFGSQVPICTVIGFPLGYTVQTVKIRETEQAVADGAAEIDMVINIAAVKSGRLDLVKAEIADIKQACGGHILKVIIETCYLTEEEKIALCKIITETGADFIKTSTGFGTAGATLSDIALFKAHIGPNVKIKAAGGIKTRSDMEAFIAVGVDRIGTSSAVRLLIEN